MGWNPLGQAHLRATGVAHGIFLGHRFLHVEWRRARLAEAGDRAFSELAAKAGAAPSLTSFLMSDSPAAPGIWVPWVAQTGRSPWPTRLGP